VPPRDLGSDPRDEYRRRLALRRGAFGRLVRRDELLSTFRLVFFVVFAVLAVLVLGTDLVHAAWLLLPGLGFVALVVAHDRCRREKSRTERAVALYERGLSRLDDRWAGTGETGVRFLDPGHPYAIDLDLFGRGSLFELLSTARTRAGEAVLAEWLLAPAAADVVKDRQRAVEELRPHLELREELALIGERVAEGVHPEAFERWAGAAPARLPSWLRPVAGVLTATTTIVLVAWPLLGTGPVPLVIAALVQAAVVGLFRKPVRLIIEQSEIIESELPLLASVMERLEREPFATPALRVLQERLREGGEPASQHLARLARLIGLLEQRRNQYFAPLAALFSWGTQFAVAIEDWRVARGGSISVWLRAAGELEALSALASHAYEHPDDAQAEIVADGPLYDAQGLGHPLLPESSCVRNDVRVDSSTPLLVVSGSNMSGKSTLLRSVGVSAIMALAGAPVRARALRISPLAVGASIRVLDSLRDGTSQFMAEVLRIRQLVRMAKGGEPLLFLIDEMLGGTNSHDRKIGAEALLRALVELSAAGLVTTHDLALTAIADGLAPRAANVHFQDRVEEGEMLFDYTLRHGVVTRSNALDLMRSVGLDV